MITFFGFSEQFVFLLPESRNFFDHRCWQRLGMWKLNGGLACFVPLQVCFELVPERITEGVRQADVLGKRAVV